MDQLNRDDVPEVSLFKVDIVVKSGVEEKMSRTRRTALVIVLITTLFQLACGDAERKGPAFPEMHDFADRNIKYTVENLGHEYTLIFKPMDNLKSNQTAIDAVKHFEDVEGIEFNKFVLGDLEQEMKTVFKDWASVKADKEFEKNLFYQDQMAFMTLFKSKDYTWSFIADREKSQVSNLLVVKSLYEVCLGMKEPFEVFSSHKPEKYLDIEGLVEDQGIEKNEGSKIYILIAQSPSMECKNREQVITKMFDDNVSSLDEAQGIVLVNSDYSDIDIAALKHNWKLQSEVFRINERAEKAIKSFNKANLGYKANLIISITGSENVKAEYVLRCEDMIYAIGE